MRTFTAAFLLMAKPGQNVTHTASNGQTDRTLLLSKRKGHRNRTVHPRDITKEGCWENCSAAQVPHAELQVAGPVSGDRIRAQCPGSQ